MHSLFLSSHLFVMYPLCALLIPLSIVIVESHCREQ